MLIKTSHLAYSQVELLQQINEARNNTQAIVYLDIDETIRIRGDNYDIDFNLMTKIEKKQQGRALQSKNPFLPPFETGMHITQLGPKHRLIFNKFSIFKNHVLIVTKDFEPQESRLSEDDFRQCIFVQGSLGGIYYYNSGQDSGASQKHKHIQLLPSEARNMPFLFLIERWTSQARETAEQLKQMTVLSCKELNFLHGIVLLPKQKDLNNSVRNFKQAYDMLYEKLVRHHKVSYNLVGTERFMMVVPRKKEKAFDEVSINSMGFTGSILFKSQKHYAFFQKLRPEEIIADITFSSEEELLKKLSELTQE